MIPYRGLLIAFIAAVLALASSPLHAKKGQPSGPSRSPGTPGVWLTVKPSDLVVSSIQLTAVSEIKCIGYHLGQVWVNVAIQNKGPGPASSNIPAAEWFGTWSVINYSFWGSWLQQGPNLSSLKVLPAGATKTFLKVPVTVRANVATDKSSSSIGIGVMVNPSHYFIETNYLNNWITKSFSFGAEFCPPQ